jgi:geranylgeranylglycerol-phosphate geranylgeranyltransferase
MKSSDKMVAVYPVFSLGFMRSYLITMRPYLLFVSGVAGWAGLALSPSEISFGKYIFAFVAYFLGYGFGQALTDVFQTDTDSISSPYRPLVRGIISKKSVMSFSLFGLIAIGAILTYLNKFNICILSASAIGLLTYTYFKKNYWMLGPFWNSWIVMLLPLSGFICTKESFSVFIGLNQNLVLLCIMSFFSYANFVVIGYLKDITADRETGYRTFPVVFGWNPTLWLGDINLLISFFITYYLVYTSDNFIAFPFLTAALIIGASGQLYGHLTKNKTEKNSAIPVAATVRYFILLHLSVIVSYKPAWAIFAFLFYLLFEMVLKGRPQKEQI